MLGPAPALCWSTLRRAIPNSNRRLHISFNLGKIGGDNHRPTLCPERHTYVFPPCRINQPTGGKIAIRHELPPVCLQGMAVGWCLVNPSSGRGGVRLACGLALRPRRLEGVQEGGLRDMLLQKTQ